MHVGENPGWKSSSFFFVIMASSGERIIRYISHVVTQYVYCTYCVVCMIYVLWIILMLLQFIFYLCAVLGTYYKTSQKKSDIWLDWNKGILFFPKCVKVTQCCKIKSISRLSCQRERPSKNELYKENWFWIKFAGIMQWNNTSVIKWFPY